MAISWGPWDYGTDGSSRGMRVGIETSFSAVSNTSTICTVTYEVWTQNYLTWGGDAQLFDFDGNYDGAETYSFQNGGTDPETKLRVIKTYKYTYSPSSYGSSPATADFNAEVIHTYNGMNPTQVVHVPIPARPYGTPAAPSGCAAARVSDTSTVVTWDRNATTGKPYNAMWLERYVYNYSTWARIATLAGTATSYTDTATVPNRKYSYRVQADNTVGTSGYSQISPAPFYTTPATPTAVTRTASGTNQVITWNTNVGYTEYATEIWRAINGTYTLLATYAPEVSIMSGTLSYTDTDALAGSKVKYKLRTRTLTGTPLYSADSAETTETSGVITVPNAPTNLKPATGTVDPTDSIQFTWTHNPTDGAAQSAYQVQYRYVGDPTWIQTGKIISTASSWTMPADTVNKGRQVEWQVQTWGASATASPFSATATWTTSPIISVRYPVYLDVTSGRLEAMSSGVPSGGAASPPASGAYYRAAALSFAQTVVTPWVWDTVENAASGISYDIATGIFTVTTPGWYLITSNVRVMPTAVVANAYYQHRLYLNGVHYDFNYVAIDSSTSGHGVTLARQVKLAAGDTFYLAGLSNVAATVSLFGHSNNVQVSRIDAGPALAAGGGLAGVGSVVDPLKLADTGWIDGGTGASVLVANATNLTLTGSMIRIRGGVCQFYIAGTLKVASSAPTATGDITSYGLGTLAAAYNIPASTYRPLSTGITGRLLASFIDGGGNVVITAIGGTTALAVGETVSVGGTFLL